MSLIKFILFILLIYMRNIIALLIVVVISMVIYVQYNANKSVEGFFDNTGLWGWARIKCGDDGKISNSDTEYCKYNDNVKNGHISRSIKECNKNIDGQQKNWRNIGPVEMEKVPKCNGDAYQLDLLDSNDRHAGGDYIFIECPLSTKDELSSVKDESCIKNSCIPQTDELKSLSNNDNKRGIAAKSCCEGQRGYWKETCPSQLACSDQRYLRMTPLRKPIPNFKQY